MRYVLSCIILIAALFLGFQNCGKTSHESELYQSSIGYSFEYPYAEKPIFYVDTHLHSTNTAGKILDHFKVVTNIAYPKDQGATIEYNLSIRSPDGNMVCPSKQGHLSAGSSQIVVDCVSPVKITSVIVNVLAVTADDVQNFNFKF